jgi:predicted NACHT family NTPase
MANSLIASDRGLQLVNDARQRKGWNRTDPQFQAAAGNISRATLNRFYAQQPIKHDGFVAICKAVGIEKWQRVATVLAVSLVEPPQELEVKIQSTALAELDRELRDWFKALRYEIEPDYLVEADEYFEWIIRIPLRSRFDRVLIHGITGEAGMQDLARVEAVVKERNLDEGCLVTDYRVSRSVAAYLALEEERGNDSFAFTRGDRIVCLTFDELIDRDVDFTPYIEWLEGEVQRLGIDKDYIQLNCSKPEKDPRTGKYLPPIEGSVGAEQIDEYMDEWLYSAQKNHISVLGEFGTGKTWFAMHYAWVQMQAYQQAKSKRMKRPRLPLLITLRDYAKALNVDTVIAGFFFVNHNIRLNADVFDRLNRMGKLLILFDGFDEMANKINSQDAIDNFWALADVIGENSKVILTCRTEHFPTTEKNQRIFAGGERASTHARVATTPKFEIMNLHSLSSNQIQQILTNRGATPEIIEKILANPELADLVKRPMMLDLVLAALPEISAGISTGQRIDLARVYLYALKHKLAQDIETKRTFTSMADKLFFLCEVSWAMLSQNRLTLHYSQFPERLKELFGDVIEDNQLDHWHYDMMCQTILIRDHDGNYRPANKSLLEFFVAFKFAAELGLLHDDFLALVREPSEQDLPIAERDYPWKDYWRYCRETQGKRVEIARFKRLEISKLVETFGASPMISTVTNLLLPMLDLEVNYRQINPLLELIQWTQWKPQEQVKCLGSNAGSLLVKLNSHGLDYQDLSETAQISSLQTLGVISDGS